MLPRLTSFTAKGERGTGLVATCERWNLVHVRVYHWVETLTMLGERCRLPTCLFVA